MKQKSLLKVFFLLCALIVGSGSVWADVSTLTFTAACGGSGTADDGAEWTVTSDGTESAYDGTKGIHYGTGKAAVQYIKLNTSDISGTITQIKVNASGASGVTAALYVTVGGENFGTQNQSISTSATNYTFNGSGSGDIEVTLTKSSSTTGALYVKSIAVTYTSGGGGSSTVSNPSFKFGTGTYTTAKSEELSCSTDGATIHYTMTEDGTTPDDPTESDATYSSAISVTKSGTIIKAKAFKSEMTASSVVTATYTIKPNKPTITGGASVTITGDDGCTFYYTTATGSDDPATPDNESTEYTAPFTPADGTKIKAIAYDAYGNKSDATSVFTFKYMPLDPKNINSNYYVKVTDASTLENGDAILIVCEEDNNALSTTQNDNNRSDYGVTINNGIIQNPHVNVQKIVLVKKSEKISDTDTDVFYFYTGTAGYLYAAASGNNYLRTEVMPDNNNNARATIDISNGNATILFTGNYTRNDLRHNNSSHIFSCYASSTTQHVVQIYKEVVPPTVSGTITAAGWNTFSSNYALDLSTITGGAAYVATGAGENVTLTETSAKVEAGEGLMIKGTAGATFTISTTSDDATLTRDNLLVGLPNGGTVAKNNNNYVFAWSTADVSTAGFYLVNDAEPNLGAGKAYLHTNGGGAKLNIVIEDSETDGIRSIENGTANGETFFNLAGQKVDAAYKGIVIVNGKKYVRK